MHAIRRFTLVVIMTMAAAIALTVRETFGTSVAALDPQALEAQHLERSRAADTARWNAMSEHYQTSGGPQSMDRSRAAETARWTAMSEYYQELEQSHLQRSRAADAARWNAMAEYYQRNGQ